MSDVTIPEDPAVQADIPVDVLNSAVDLCRKLSLKTTPANVRPIARAILAETERCAKVCEDQKIGFLSQEYAFNQPLGSLTERFACDECAQAIRSSHD